ncbi:MAG: hypothetical protein QOG80_594 [Pseudonocardiales bacterium]|nr:hypothetical protein [Pseudonocardiales bacterium]
MRRVTWATMASADPMGQQHYERQIQRAVSDVADADWQFEEIRLGSLRSSIPHVRRIPMGLYQSAPLPLALALGGASYRTRGLVHRLDLRIPPSPGREVVTIHDLPPLRFADEGSLPASAAAGARRARRVVCPSQFAADEVRELLGVDPSRLRVIFNGVGPEFRTDGDAETLPVIDGVDRPFVLHAAGATQRKNLASLADAWRIVSQAHPGLTLVLAGPDDPRRTALFGSIESASLVGRLAPTAVASLMRRAATVVVPSTYEGFGLPALEAMACGRPVVAANAGALPEICGDAAILVEPTAEGIAEGIESALTDEALVARLAVDGPARAKSFTWARAAQQHLDVYREVLG